MKSTKRNHDLRNSKTEKNKSLLKRIKKKFKKKDNYHYLDPLIDKKLPFQWASFTLLAAITLSVINRHYWRLRQRQQPQCFTVSQNAARTTQRNDQRKTIGETNESKRHSNYVKKQNTPKPCSLFRFMKTTTQHRTQDNTHFSPLCAFVWSCYA